MLDSIYKKDFGKKIIMDSKVEGQVKPIVFLNTPITNEDKDAIGITSAVEMVKNAIDNNARSECVKWKLSISYVRIQK